MKDPANLERIIILVKEQEPERQDLILALKNCKNGKWQDIAYYKFVNSTNANQVGAEWQFDESIILEDDKLGDIVIDYLKDKRIGGIEYLKYVG